MQWGWGVLCQGVLVALGMHSCSKHSQRWSVVGFWQTVYMAAASVATTALNETVAVLDCVIPWERHPVVPVWDGICTQSPVEDSRWSSVWVTDLPGWWSLHSVSTKRPRTWGRRAVQTVRWTSLSFSYYYFDNSVNYMSSADLSVFKSDPKCRNILMISRYGRFWISTFSFYFYKTCSKCGWSVKTVETKVCK